MDLTKRTLLNLTIAAILAMGIWFRVSQYGDLRLSVGMPDTGTFIESANAPIFSLENFSSRRLFTTNLLYRLSLGKECPAPIISIPFEGNEIDRSILECFSSIAVIQNLLSVIGWSLLALTTARWLRSPIYKILSMIIILSFGFSPQIAEWDSILSSEALSISLLAFMLALLLESVFRITHYEEGASSNRATNFLFFFWMLIFLLWCFTRDVQIYAIAVTLLLAAPLLYFREIRRIKILAPTLIILGVAFLLGVKTAQASDRWQLSMTHVMNYHILPYPSRVDAMINKGMPSPESVEEYNIWLNAHANKDYGTFLVTHPGFIIKTIFDLAGYLNSDFLQPYFNLEKNQFHDQMQVIGEMLHPQTNGVYLLSFLLVISLIRSSITQENKTTMTWAWLAVWIFVYGSISLLLSLFGDIDGTRRHIYPSVELFRLSNWIFLFVHLDLMNPIFPNSKPDSAKSIVYPSVK